MLLLAGLMGIAGVGAASFAVFNLQETEDEDPVPEEDVDIETTGNLLDDTEGASGQDINGTDYADVLIGGPSDDVISGGDDLDQIGGYDGDDVLSGGAGNDVIYGGFGVDSIFGGSENDQLHGNEDDDLLYGEIGFDTLFGHTGDDQLSGGEDDDSLVGSSGNDTLLGDGGHDALIGGLDNDSLWGGTGADVLNGGAGNDVLNGLAVGKQGLQYADSDTGDYLNGGGGDDTIIAGNDDIVTGGEGSDDILLGDWISQGQEAEITDYDASEDSLMLVWDDMMKGATEPNVEVAPDEHDNEVMHVLMNGKSVAEVYGDPNLNPSDITIIPLSSALIVNLQAA